MVTPPHSISSSSLYVSLNDLGWRYLAQHMDMLLPPELLKAIDPVPFGKYAMQEE